MKEPQKKRTIAFFDCQNLFHSVKGAFGYTFPNFNPVKLAQRICDGEGWDLMQTRVYTGVPPEDKNYFWHHFWTNKLGQMTNRNDTFVYSRPLKYVSVPADRNDPGGDRLSIGQEKGIDVRLAVDIISLAWRDKYDVALVFSQDQDLAEAAREIRGTARDTGRWIKIASAFPVNHKGGNRGVDGTDWLRFERQEYEACIDHNDYRPEPQGKDMPSEDPEE